MARHLQQFMFTSDNINLTDVQRHFYEHNGYLIIPKLVPDDILDQCLDHFSDICNKRVKPPNNMVLMKDLGLINSGKVGEYLYYKINDFLQDDIFFKYASYCRIVDIVSSIIGPNVTATHSMFINKPPDSSSDASRHPLHQDLHYFPFRPAEKVVASWTALERIDERNGCLFAISGSHKWKLYPHTYPENVKNKAFHGAQGFDDIPKVNFVMEKGDTVFFHPVLLHGSGPNLSKGFRRAISVHYADTNCKFIDVTGTSQEEIAKEVVGMFAKKGVRLVYEDIWKYKGRLIKGPPGNFQKFVSRL